MCCHLSCGGGCIPVGRLGIESVCGVLNFGFVATDVW